MLTATQRTSKTVFFLARFLLHFARIRALCLRSGAGRRGLIKFSMCVIKGTGRFFNRNRHLMSMRWGGLILAALFWGMSLTPARAILFYSTGDPAYNTNAPTGSYTNSGWQYEGQWHSFLGTAIGPHYFVSAKHVGGAVGDAFIFQGKTNVTTAVFSHPKSDLQIWQVRDALPAYAPLYSRADEVNRDVVIIGRGTQRGDPINIDSVYGHSLKGWYWGATDSLQRWGDSPVAGAMHDPTSDSDVLYFNFTAGGLNQAGISVGDSGGGVFIQDNGVWKLAGTIWAVDGPYNTTNNGSGFYGAIFDMGGLYQWSGTNWIFQTETRLRQPQYFFTTRVSSYVSWIQQILALPVNGPALLSSDRVDGAYITENAAVIDTTARTISISPSNNILFYRLQDTVQRHILSLTLRGGKLVFTYE